MKRTIIVLIIIIFCGNISRAQELTVEYNFGYGTYCMRDLKSYLEEISPLSGGRELENLKITDNFPGNWTHQLKLGVEVKRSHNIGVSIDFMNTAGQKALSDYSGSYKFTHRTNGKRLGLFYRISPYSWFSGTVRPYFMLTAGVVLSKDRLDERLILDDTSIFDENISLKGAMAFTEPALGCKIRLHENFALNLNAGYHVDLDKIYKYNSNSAFDSPTWGGLRFQGGVIFYVPLSR